MKRILLTLLTLTLVSLACAAPAWVPTVTPTLAPTVRPASTATRASAPVTEEPQTAIVRQPVVNVRDAANGNPTGEYIYAGQEVTILERAGDWIKIENPAGWVFIGCLEGSKRRCVAK